MEDQLQQGLDMHPSIVKARQQKAMVRAGTAKLAKELQARVDAVCHQLQSSNLPGAFVIDLTSGMQPVR